MNQAPLLIANFASPITGATWTYSIDPRRFGEYQLNLIDADGVLRNFGFIRSTEQDVIAAKLFSMLGNLERYDTNAMHSRFD